MSATEYYITNGYLGKRLFKWDRNNNKVVQVVVDPGEERKGRPNMIGVYVIMESTLRGNYLWHLGRKAKPPYKIRPTTAKLFNYYADKVLKMIL